MWGASIECHHHHRFGLIAWELNCVTKIGSIIIQLDFINWQAISHWLPGLFVLFFFFFFWKLGIYFCCCLWFSFRLNKFNSLHIILYFVKFSKIFSPLNSLNSGALDESFSQYSSVQSLSHVRLFVSPQTAMHQAALPIINSWSLSKLRSTASVMP